jgi:glycosyltransferase involved in cell wall biosynthesis
VVSGPAQPLIAAVIPAFNEERSIVKVVEAVKQYAEPIVVDDGSRDLTGQLAKHAGAIVVAHSHNNGYDAALETGLFKAIELGFSFAITIDADGQHNAESIVEFKESLLQGADLVVGIRNRHQRLSESLFAAFGKRLWKISDPLCGMKGYKLSHLSLLGYFDSYKSIGTEFALRCARSKLRIDSVPVITRERSGDSRFGAGFKAEFRIFRAMVIGIVKTKGF